jgi:hypothetical protein
VNLVHVARGPSFGSGGGRSGFPEAGKYPAAGMRMGGEILVKTASLTATVQTYPAECENLLLRPAQHQQFLAFHSHSTHCGSSPSWPLQAIDKECATP